MKRYFVILLVAVGTILIGCLTNCSREYKAYYREYLIFVDSIKVPDNINSGIPFHIEFYGTISVTGCSGFSHFSTNLSDTVLYIEAWKWLEISAVACPAIIVKLDGETLEYQLDVPGSYQIKILQPDFSFLIENIEVK